MKLKVKTSFTRDVTFKLPQDADTIDLVATVEFSIDPDLQTKTDEGAYKSAVIGIYDVKHNGQSILVLETPLTPQQIKQALGPRPPKPEPNDGEVPPIPDDAADKPEVGISAWLLPACANFWRDNRVAAISGNSKP